MILFCFLFALVVSASFKVWNLVSWCASLIYLLALERSELRDSLTAANLSLPICLFRRLYARPIAAMTRTTYLLLRQQDDDVRAYVRWTLVHMYAVVQSQHALNSCDFVFAVATACLVEQAVRVGKDSLGRMMKSSKTASANLREVRSQIHSPLLRRVRHKVWYILQEVKKPTSD